MCSTRHVVCLATQGERKKELKRVCAKTEDKGVGKPDGHLHRDSLEERLFEQHVRGHFLASRVHRHLNHGRVEVYASRLHGHHWVASARDARCKSQPARHYNTHHHTLFLLEQLSQLLSPSALRTSSSTAKKRKESNPAFKQTNNHAHTDQP